MTTALTVLIVCLIGGLGLGVSGVYVVFGVGWSMMLGAAILLTVSAIIYRGMTDV